MVAKFDRNGVAFQYPENWQLTDDSGQASACCVTLQSPRSGFWMLQAFEANERPEGFAAAVLEEVRSEYDLVEANSVNEPICDVDTSGYDIQFYCLDFVVRASVRSFAVGPKTYVILCQAEDREFDEIGPVFLAMTTSLLRLAAS